MSGELQPYGYQLRDGALLAVEEINARGGLLGHKLALAVVDDQGKPERGVSVAEIFVKQGVSLVVGHFQSAVSIPASAVYGATGTLMMTPSATNAELTEQAARKGWKTIFRICNHEDQEGEVAARWILKHYPGKNVAVLEDGKPYGRGIARKAEQTLRAGGIIPVLVESFSYTENDFHPLIEKMKAKAVDVVVVGSYHDDGARLLRQAREAGIQAEWITDDAVNSAEYATIAGEHNVENVRFLDATPPSSVSSGKIVIGKLQQHGYSDTGYTVVSYSVVEAFAAAVQGTNSVDAEKMAAWLRSHSVNTAIGEVSWDAKGDIQQNHYAWYVWHQGVYSYEPSE
jgi:branched-chain amino acid transport system substrate-binding protein